MMKVKDIMKIKVITCSPDETIQEVAGKMDKHDIKEMPVIENKKLVGLVTYYDALGIKTPVPVKANKIMIKPPTISPNEDITSLLKLMVKSAVEGIPVLKKEKLVGFVSEYDVLKEYLKSDVLNGVLVKDVIRINIPHLNEADSVQKAKRLMGFHNVDRLSVVDKNKRYIGTILLIDILRHCFKQIKTKVGATDRGADFQTFMSGPVKEITRKNLPEIYPNMPIRKALRKLLNFNLKGIGVINLVKEPVGLLLRKDVLKLIFEKIEKKGVMVNFSGIDLEPSSLKTLQEILSERIKKIIYLTPQIYSVQVHIKPVHDAVVEKRYQIKLSLKKPGRSFNVKEEGWDIFFTFDNILNRLERVIYKEYYEKGPETRRIRKIRKRKKKRTGRR